MEKVQKKVLVHGRWEQKKVRGEGTSWGKTSEEKGNQNEKSSQGLKGKKGDKVHEQKKRTGGGRKWVEQRGIGQTDNGNGAKTCRR